MRRQLRLVRSTLPPLVTLSLTPTPTLTLTLTPNLHPNPNLHPHPNPRPNQVRSILPLLVRHELRRHPNERRRGDAHVEARFVKGGGAEGGAAALCAEATALADSMIDGLSAQVDSRGSSRGRRTSATATLQLLRLPCYSSSTAATTRWTRWWTRSSRRSTSTATAASRWKSGAPRGRVPPRVQTPKAGPRASIAPLAPSAR